MFFFVFNRAFPTVTTCYWWHRAWPRDFGGEFGFQAEVGGKVRTAQVTSKEERPIRQEKVTFLERRSVGHSLIGKQKTIV